MAMAQQGPRRARAPVQLAHCRQSRAYKIADCLMGAGLEPDWDTRMVRFGWLISRGSFSLLSFAAAQGPPRYLMKMSSSTRCIERTAPLKGQRQRYPPRIR